MINETKHDKFKRLAKQRGDRTLKDLKLIANLSNRNNYDFTEEDVRILFSAIDDELKAAKSQFSINRVREIKF
jgi:hypothetical protein